jgi:hypothetical protein
MILKIRPLSKGLKTVGYKTLLAPRSFKQLGFILKGIFNKSSRQL